MEKHIQKAPLRKALRLRRPSELRRPSPEYIRILEAEISNLSRQEVLARASLFIQEKKPSQLITANSLMIYEMRGNPRLIQAFQRASLVIAESAGVLWASRFLGCRLKERFPGIDIMISLCALAAKNGWPVFLLGAKEGIAALAARRLNLLFPKLVLAGAHHGYFTAEEEQGIFNAIRKSGARIVFVGLDVPRQEIWIHERLKEMPALVMGVGGSLDVLSGGLRRAPPWMRFLGLEWLFRFLQEPWRWKRILNLPRFAIRIIAARFGLAVL